MIVVLSSSATPGQIDAVVSRVEALGFRPHLVRGEERTIIGVIGDDRRAEPQQFENMDGVDQVLPVLRPFKLAAREMSHGPTRVTVGQNAVLGGETVVVAAGPCAVESREQLLESASAAREGGARMLRGGAFKPRTSPYAFQGLGEKGIEFLVEARKVTGLPFVTEVMAPAAVDLVAQHADMLQIGARNMQNFDLLREVGRTRKPVLLKRALSGTLEELLMAAEYVLAGGNPNVVLCERGIRTFEKATRNTLDLSAIAVLKEWSHLPVIVDPSHGTGKRSFVLPMSLAAVAAGADGLLIEMHPNPDRALSDGPQSITPQGFQDLMQRCRAVAVAVSRSL
jgi:3-deoxy-7-phosphoheptulonate synthase